MNTWTVADSAEIVADITLADELDVLDAIEDAPEARVPSMEMRKADAFRALDLSEIPPQLRTWAAFEAGIRFAQERAK